MFQWEALTFHQHWNQIKDKSAGLQMALWWQYLWIMEKFSFAMQIAWKWSTWKWAQKKLIIFYCFFSVCFIAKKECLCCILGFYKVFMLYVKKINVCTIRNVFGSIHDIPFFCYNCLQATRFELCCFSTIDKQAE